MTRTVRTLLFSFFLLFFAVAAPSLALYAQGYRLNWPLEPGKKLIVKTGAFFFKTAQKQVSINVNGKLEKQTDFIFGSALIENFLPRNYLIEIKKPGFQTWAKNLDIREKEVTEARNIFLFPDRLSFTPVETNASSTIASPDGTKFILRGSDDKGWNLKLYDVSKGITSGLAGETDFAPKGAELVSWEWAADSKTINLALKEDKNDSRWTLAIDKNPARISKIISAAATSTEELAFENTATSKFFLNRDGFLYRKDFNSITTKIGNAQMAVEPDSKYRLWAFADYYFAAKNNELYILEPGEDSFEKILDGLAGEPKISPDGKKILYASDSEIWIMITKGKADQPPANASDRIFIARFSEKIADCDWFNSDYVIFAAGDKIKTAEIDNRDRINIAELATFSTIDSAADPAGAKLVWSPAQKSIYLFLGNSLYKSQPIQ